jgi:hypothetical protein
MRTDEAVAESLNPKQRMLELFADVPFSVTFHRVIAGLHSPKGSGEYKFARFQMLRLLSPVSGVLVPLLILLLLFISAFWLPSQVQDALPAMIKPVEPAPPLDPVPVEPPEKLKVPDVIGIAAGPIVETVMPKVAGPIAEAPVNAPPVLLTRSPVQLRNFFAGGLSARQKKGLYDNGGSHETERAVSRALRWLQFVQEEDGSWRLESGGGPGKGAAPAMTGLGLLTFLAHGETTSSKEFGITVEGALRWLAYNQEADGRVLGRDSHDYSHPIATYAVCEAFAANKTPMLKEVAAKAVEVILNGQHPDGGWDYNCRQSERSDTSYMGWCIQALKAAQIAGIGGNRVDAAIKRSHRALKRNYHSSGSFGYTGPQPGNLTGVGVLCMQLIGAAGSAEVKAGLSWLERATCDWSKPWGKAPLYYWYYITQAKFHEGGATWNDWNDMMKPELIDSQTVLVNGGGVGKDLGYWQACSNTEQCKSYVYNTTLCALTLQVYYRTLRTFGSPELLAENVFEDENEDIPLEVELR